MFFFCFTVNQNNPIMSIYTQNWPFNGVFHRNLILISGNRGGGLLNALIIMRYFLCFAVHFCYPPLFIFFLFVNLRFFQSQNRYFWIFSGVLFLILLRQFFVCFFVLEKCLVSSQSLHAHEYSIFSSWIFFAICFLLCRIVFIFLYINRFKFCPLAHWISYRRYGLI